VDRRRGGGEARGALTPPRPGPVRTYLLRRVLTLIPLLLGVTLLAFLLTYLAPGDFLSQMAENPMLSAETIDQMRRKFGLDQPWYVQYALWLKNVFLHLDFGESFAYRQPVFEVIAPRMGNTLLLALAAAVVAWGLAIPLGILSAVKQYKWQDKVASFTAFLGLSIPEIFFALLLMYFAAKTGWFPVGGMRSIDHDELQWGAQLADIAHHLILPALVLGTVPMAARMRQMRANLLDVLRLDYVTTARAKGLDDNVVVWKHAVRNAINPLITLFGFTLASLLSGSFIVEIVMNWPGLGSLTLEALQKQDLYLVMGSVVMAATMLMLGNLIADVMLAIADPRIKYD
jgi:peptide/nickel transport system permease protein